MTVERLLVRNTAKDKAAADAVGMTVEQHRQREQAEAERCARYETAVEMPAPGPRHAATMATLERRDVGIH